MSGGTAQQLKLRLFIEGVEVPIIAATVQAAPNSPAMCSLQIPPLAEGTRFLPRSLVHLFFLDLYETQSPFISLRGDSAPKKVDPSVYEQGLVNQREFRSIEEAASTGERDVRNSRYKLLFGGEMVGFGWTKSTSNRSLVLQCADFSNYWDYAYQWNNTDLFGPGIKAMFSGGSTNLFEDFLSDEGSEIIKIINTPSPQYPKLKGLLGGLIHLLEAIGGSYYYGKQYVGQNTFFSLAELRLHVTQMITAFENDPTASNLLGAGYDSLFGRTLGGLGAQVSFRQAINALMSAIFHETYPIPTPMYVPGTAGSVSGAVRRRMANDPRFKALAELADNLIDGLQSLITSMTLDEAAGDGSTSKVEVKKRMLGMSSRLKEALNITGSIKEIQGTRGFLGSANTLLVQAANTKLTKYAPGNPASAQPAVLNLNSAIDQLKRVKEFEVTSAGASKGVPARLNAQIFRPDVWFSAPPRCNVLFPEHYFQLDYQRMFLQEPTRFLLKTNDEFFGEDELFDQFFFAPKGRTVKAQQRDLQGMLANDLLDHELFTGILPVFEKMGELNIFAARTGKVNGKQPKIGLAQRSTNFLYFKHRFAARTMSVSGRFNPYIAPGFPGLIIDKYVDAQRLIEHQELVQKYAEVNGTSSNVDINKLLGTHFLGNFTQVTHAVDQRNGRTEIQCGYPRQYEETVEFLGATKEDQNVQKRFGPDATRSTDVAAFNPPRVQSIGPNFGIIVKVEEVTNLYHVNENDTESRQLPLLIGSRRQGTGELKIKVPIDVPLEASKYGEDIVQLVGNRNQIVRFRAFRVYEEIPRYRQEKIDLPAEEYIRPGWYGDCWHPSKIGAVYNQFFGVGAITDPQQAADPAGASTGTQDKDAADAIADQFMNPKDEARQTAPALLTLDKDSSIQQAVAFLVRLYSYVKQGGLDVEEFIRAYVWRPVASLIDMFGTTDLALDPDGHSVISGIEGFHSRAFGPYEDLFGMVPPDMENIVGIKRNKSAAGNSKQNASQTASRADVRKRRQDAVKEYVSALEFSRAILG